MSMKAIKVTVDSKEWSKVNGFLQEVSDDNIFAYQVDRTSFLMVTENEYGMAYLQTNLPVWFDEEVTIINLK